MLLSEDSIQEHLPHYLSQDSKDNLIGALRAFPKQFDCYSNIKTTEILQGDCWSSIEVTDFRTGRRDFVKGILLSNSCDVTPENKHMLPPNLTFSPIIKLSSYLDLLKKAGINKEQIREKRNAIVEQRVTTLFYLPSGAGLDDDHVALLSDVHTVPYPSFYTQDNKQRLSVFSQVGFYLFIFKLSVHFCRMQERVDRDAG